MRRFKVGEGGFVTGNRSLLVSSLMLVYVLNDAFDFGMMKRFYVAASEEHKGGQFGAVKTDPRRSD